jgi:prepilin-type N-terminal cleavage/methylation domain-containing protein
MNTPRHQLHGRRGAFTMIELLVVIGVIAILAGLIMGAAGIMSSKARQKRVEAERDTLLIAIQRYKQDKGSYPPDNPGNPAKSQLFYELTGMVATLGANGAPVSFKSPVTGEVFQVSDLTTIFGPAVQGFVNASADPTQIKNYFDKVSIKGRTATFTAGARTYTLFGVPVKGPPAEEMTGNDGSRISPMNYVSTNPTNNPDSYDLWIDVIYGGGTTNVAGVNRAIFNRINNWSQTPEPH